MRSSISIGGLMLPSVLILLLVTLSGCGNSTSEKDKGTEATEQTPVHTHTTQGETCFICDESKREPGRLWCSEHARYEDRCWMCQPQLEDKARLFCKEHSLYEDECFLCHPEIKETTDEASSGSEQGMLEVVDGDSGSSSVLFCNEHKVPENECGICQPQRTAELQPGDELKVRFESSLSAQKAGLLTSLPGSLESRLSISAICEVRYNQNELAQITPYAKGIVKRVLVDVGAEVKAGDALVEIHSVELAAARAAFISSSVDLELKGLTYEREKDLNAKKISSEQDLQEAAAKFRNATLALDTAKHRLLNFGLSPHEVSQITETNDNSATLLIRAPFGGTLVDRDVVRGEAVEPGDALFTLSDLSTMWLSLSIPADHAFSLESGMDVEAALGGMSGSTVRGILTWVNTAIDEKTRMVRARALVPNETRQLRAGMFGDAQVFFSSNAPALTVPVSAVQFFQDRHFVFVKKADDLFALRRITLGPNSNDVVTVTAGLQASDPVVVEGAFTAMSEFLKSRLGAGCVDD